MLRILHEAENQETDGVVFELPSELSKGQVIKVDFCYPYNLLIIRIPSVKVQPKQVIRLSVLSTHFWFQEGRTLAIGKQYLISNCQKGID